MTKLNHNSDLLKKIDDKRRSIEELNLMSKELANPLRQMGALQHQVSDAVFVVIPELGINSDFEKLKKKLEKIDVSRSSLEIQNLSLAVKSHLKEFLRFYRLIKKATSSSDLSIIPDSYDNLQTIKDFRGCLREYLLERLTYLLDGKAEPPFDKSGMTALLDVINDHESLANSANAEVQALLNDFDRVLQHRK